MNLREMKYLKVVDHAYNCLKRNLIDIDQYMAVMKFLSECENPLNAMFEINFRVAVNKELGKFAFEKVRA